MPVALRQLVTLRHCSDKHLDDPSEFRFLREEIPDENTPQIVIRQITFRFAQLCAENSN